MRSLVSFAGIVCASAIGGLMLLSTTMVPDLFDLTPRIARSGNDVLLAWYDLHRDARALQRGGLASGTPLRALGYMMEANQPVPDGRPVTEFVLLPDAGNAVHPAHRFGDAMISVRLAGNASVPFCRRCLVWVWGTLQVLPGNPAGPEPLYRLDGARSTPAASAEISRYFR